MKEDWIECTLGKVFETVTGNTPSTKDKDNYGSEIPFIKPPQINNNILKTSSEFLSATGKIKARILPENSVLVTCIGNLGRVGINKTEVAFNQQINAIKPITGIESKYTFYQAQSISFRNQLEALSTSTTVALVNKTNFNSIKFRIVPLPIQRAIVAKLEELFSSLDSGIADLKQAQDQLVIYRQAVLKKAFEGEWEKVKLEDVSIAFGGYPFKSTTYLDKGRFQVLRIGNIRPGLIRYHENPVYVENIDENVLNRYLLSENDVVISLTGTRTKRDYGHTAIIKSEHLLLNQRIAAIRFNDIYNPKFFLYFSWSEPFKEQFFGSETGNTGQGNVGMKSVRETRVPLPSIQEQHKIIQEIESRLSVCDKVEESIKESLIKAEALRQSILKKAFEGKLLSEEEIAKCKADKDYEPASILLKRIKAEKKEK